jgi:NAD(P)H-dependent FMN reductase
VSYRRARGAARGYRRWVSAQRKDREGGGADAARLRLAVIVGSTRQGRTGEVIARWFAGLASAHEAFSVRLLDLRDFPMTFYDEPVPTRSAEVAYQGEAQRRWVAEVTAADAFAIVTPEYNHSFPAVLKNALDHAYAGWNGKPVGFVSYGGLGGGIRAVEQLRLVAIELQLAPVRDEVNVPRAAGAFDEAGRPRDPLLERRAAGLLDQLAWWGHALRDARRARPMPGPKAVAPRS